MQQALPRDQRRSSDTRIREYRHGFAAEARARLSTPGGGVDTREILLELGRRRVVGGQDLIVDVALDITSRKEGA